MMILLPLSKVIQTVSKKSFRSKNSKIELHQDAESKMTSENSRPSFAIALVAVDGSGIAERAGLTAVDIARKLSAQLFILHVAKYPPNTLGASVSHSIAVGPPLSDPVIDKSKRQAAASMGRIEAYARTKKVESKREIIDTSSPIVETIADYAYQNDVGLIIVGNRGLNEFRATLIGSVSEGLVQKANCTVMVVK
jgi:nucleotide-binding universal stress UspA family protein